MIFPLKELIEFKGNIYEITCAATRRAFQLVTIQDPVLEENNDKVVCTAAAEPNRSAYRDIPAPNPQI